MPALVRGAGTAKAVTAVRTVFLISNECWSWRWACCRST